MGSKNKPRLDALDGGGSSLTELLSHIEEDIPAIMKKAAEQAKGGNAAVLTALISLFTRHAEGQQSDRGLEVMNKVLAMRAASMQRAQEAYGTSPTAPPEKNGSL